MAAELEKDEFNPRESLSAKVKDWKDWLKQGQFWIFGMVFMLIKVVVNVQMTMQPFYLTYVTRFISEDPTITPIQIALIPLISYISSSFFSIFLYRWMIRILKNRTRPLLLAILIIAGSSIPYFFFNGDPSLNWPIYICSGVLGIGLSI